jgi:hypothetical protein
VDPYHADAQAVLTARSAWHDGLDLPTGERPTPTVSGAYRCNDRVPVRERPG